jgi:amino acid adenylation domain-containing protein
MVVNTSLLHAPVEAHATRAPQRWAVVAGARMLSYGKLARDAALVAARLRLLGVGPDVPVALLLPRSPELITAMLGVLRAGGAYVPLDPSLPTARLGLLLEQSGARVVLADAATEALLPVTRAALVRLEHALEGDVEAAPDVPVDPRHLAYVIHTSGSTGRPKGVAVTHAAAVNLVDDFSARWPLGADGGYGFWASPSFDVSVQEIFLALREGGTLHIVPDDVRADARALADWLVERRIASAFAPAFVLPALATALRAAQGGATLRRLLVGVEPIDESLLRAIVASTPGLRIINGYGPTETTVCATFYDVPSGGTAAGAAPIGSVLTNVQVHLLDECLSAVPEGEAGELFIGGAGVARGYLGRPDLTAERFVPDPFASGARLYRTGDRARRRPDGELMFLGRLDRQVKLRGYRVELGEIEAALARHPDVAEALVLSRAYGPDDARLVAYVRTEGDAASDVEALRRHAQRELPAYMVPAAVVCLRAWPRNAAGKVDVDALPVPPRSAFGREAPEPPRGELEAGLTRLWGQVLALDPVGRDDDFFGFGGNSLLAAQLAARARAALGVELTALDVFRAPTPAGLARHLAGDASGRRLPPLRRLPQDGPLPLSFSQEQVWFFAELSPGAVAYNAQLSVRFRGPLDVAALERALGEIVRRHAILRTVFVEQDGRPVQRVQPPFAVELRPVEVSDAEARIAAELQRPFDVGRLPLVRWSLLRPAPDEHVLVQVEHHFVHDGWSVAVLMRELKALYAAYSAGRESALEEPAYQFADVAVWQREWLSGEVLDEQLRFWSERLRDPVPLELPLDRPRPVRQSFRGAQLRADLSWRLYGDVRRFGEREGATPFMTLLAAFALWLRRVSGQSDLLVGSGVANRRLRESEDVIGMLVNTLVLRLDAGGRPSFRELVGRAKRTVLDALAHPDLPVQKVVAALNPQRDLGRTPLYTALFSFHDSPVPDLSLGALEAELLERHNGSAKSDLNVIVVARGERGAGVAPLERAAPLTLLWEYSSDVFDDTSARRHLRHYLQGLEAALAQPDTPVDRLPWLSAAERDALTHGCNRTTAPYPREHSLTALFRAQVERAPERVALSQGERRLTYVELERQSDRLARALMALGVGRGDHVALLLARSPELIVTLLGILKAGAAYLPLPRGLPPERFTWTWHDGRVRVLVADASLGTLHEHAPGPVLRLDREDLPAAPDAAVPEHCCGDDVACVLYTSGSTGTPKGVIVPHRAIARLCLGATYARFDDIVMLHSSAVAFDAATFEIWAPLLNGGRVALAPSDDLGLTEIGATLAREGVDSAFFTTGLFNALVDEQLDSLRPLRQVLTGGEAASNAHMAAGLRGLPGLVVINGYGPTESATFATTWRLTEPPADAPVPIGRPIENTTAYVLDEWLEPLPPGVEGELCLGGDGLAHGYLGRPALSAECFVPEPFGASGARLYRTGDRARRRPDGVLEFLGRRDGQVKVRGLRIELGEIEAVLARHPGVRRAAAVVQRPADGGARVVAFAVPDNAHVAVHELEAHLERELPAYMRPGCVALVETLPLNRNGKVDRHALAEQPLEAARARPAPEACATPTERQVAAIWSELLHVPAPGRTEDFFALGGHSLAAMQVLARVRRHGAAELPLRTLFEHPRLCDFAAAVERARGDAAPPSLPSSLDELQALSDDELDALLDTTDGVEP